MRDLLFLLLTVAVFVALAALVSLCDRIIGSSDDSRSLDEAGADAPSREVTDVVR